MADDRISELPESVLHRILCFLSQKHAIQTSALSKSWRDVGPTRPKIEFKSSRFLSVLGTTLQRYIHRNLFVHEFILEMSEDDLRQAIDSESISVLDNGIPMLLLSNLGLKKFNFSVPHYVLAPSVVFRAESLTELYLSECKFMSTNHDQPPLFKGLKRLSLNKVEIDDEMLEKIVCSCPLIEYLLVSVCVGLRTIPVTLFQAEEFLAELHLSGCNLIIDTFTSTDLLLIKRLKKLSLRNVNILEETLDKIICSCPLIEHLLLFRCVQLTPIQLIQYNNHHTPRYTPNRIRIPSIKTICPNWYGHDKYFFPCLKSLYLGGVKLPPELFESFSSNFPSLEELELQSCNGFQEIQLTLCSIKRLVIISHEIERLAITIYAPNIHYFELSVYSPPQLIFYTETAREWKSRVVMLLEECSSYNKVLIPSWLLQLNQLLNSLSESQISLDIYSNPLKNLKVGDTNDACFCKPVPLEHLSVKGDYVFSSFPDFVNCLFLICRPKYIGMNWYTTPVADSKKKQKKLDEFIISQIIQNQGEMSRGYLWEQDLEEMSMQVWDEHSQGWHTIRIEGASFPGSTSSYLKTRVQVKWSD